MFLRFNFFPLVWSYLLLAVGLFIFTMPQKVDGYDRQSEGVVRITSNTLCLKGKEDFTESVLNTEVIRKQRCTFASSKRIWLQTAIVAIINQRKTLIVMS